MQSSNNTNGNVNQVSATSSSQPLFSPTSKYHPSQKGLSRRKRWLVVDFDGTCTETDTTPLLPRLAALAASKQLISNNDGEVNNNNDNDSVHKQELERRLAQFQALEDEFIKRFTEAKSILLDGEDAAREKKLSIHDVLDGLDEPSTIVTHMVSESKVLEGLGAVDVRDLEDMLQLYGVTDHSNLEVGSKDKEVKSSVGGYTNKYSADEGVGEKIVIRLREGCEHTLARIISENKGDNDNNNNDNGDDNNNKPSSCLGWSLAVLSINWCPTLISASLVRPVLKKRRSNLQMDINESCATEVPIWSNRVDGEGVVALHVPGALAKRDRIMELRRHIIIENDDDESNNSGSTTTAEGGLIVYVGDSSTDLAALLEADIGIIIGNSSSTSMIAEMWDIEIVSLQHRQEHGFGKTTTNGAAGNGHEKKKVLWQTQSWGEIDEMLIELDEQWS